MGPNNSLGTITIRVHTHIFLYPSDPEINNKKHFFCFSVECQHNAQGIESFSGLCLRLCVHTQGMENCRLSVFSMVSNTDNVLINWRAEARGEGGGGHVSAAFRLTANKKVILACNEEGEDMDTEPPSHHSESVESLVTEWVISSLTLFAPWLDLPRTLWNNFRLSLSLSLSLSLRR